MSLNILPENQTSDEHRSQPDERNQHTESRSRQLFWFVALWLLGVLAMAAIAGLFRFFVLFAYD